MTSNLAGTRPPTDDERRHAACVAMGRAPAFIRYASRYTQTVHDAEDAYQRAMEIALTRAPITEQRAYTAWLYTVLRHEALAVAGAQRRDGPASAADVAETAAETIASPIGVEAIATWRERYGALHDALGGLTEAQRTCLMLQSAGATYQRIHEVTGFSLRKVERAVLEGRRSLHRWEIRLMAGEVCERLAPLIDLTVAGEAGRRERRSVSRHVRHCGPCRARLRSRRQAQERLAALVPVALLGGALTTVPDPAPAMAWWERVSGNLTVHTGTAVQAMADLPGTAVAKVGAGAVALTVAGLAGVPLVLDAVDAPPRPAPRPALAHASVAAIPDPAVSTAPVAPVAPARTVVAAAPTRRPPARSTSTPIRTRTPAPRPATPRRPAPRPAPSPAVMPASTPSPSYSPAPATNHRATDATMALEFGP